MSPKHTIDRQAHRGFNLNFRQTRCPGAHEQSREVLLERFFERPSCRSCVATGEAPILYEGAERRLQDIRRERRELRNAFDDSDIRHVSSTAPQSVPLVAMLQDLL